NVYVYYYEWSCAQVYVRFSLVNDRFSLLSHKDPSVTYGAIYVLYSSLSSKFLTLFVKYSRRISHHTSIFCCCTTFRIIFTVPVRPREHCSVSINPHFSYKAWPASFSVLTANTSSVNAGKCRSIKSGSN